MSGKNHTRHVIDMLMILVLPLLMTYELIGRRTHEWLGVTMLTMVIVHQILNRAWYKVIFRGKYSPMRAAVLILDLSLAVLMILQAVSGMAMAKHLPDFLPKLMRRSVARGVHMTCAYWCFVLMNVHAGFHMSALLAKVKAGMRPGMRKGFGVTVLIIAVYGVYAFMKRQLPGYMLMRIQFAFFDYEEPLIFFFADYLAIMLLFAMAGYGLSMLLKNRINKERRK